VASAASAVVTIDVVEMVKENYYQEFIDLFETERTAAAGDTPRITKANTGLNYFEGQMKTWCEAGFTTKVLPDYE